jgi:hypothetical protein
MQAGLSRERALRLTASRHHRFQQIFFQHDKFWRVPIPRAWEVDLIFRDDPAVYTLPIAGE